MSELLLPDVHGVLRPPGYWDQTNDEYHAGPGTSKSDLDLVARSLRHYWAAKRAPARTERKRTDAMLLGSAVHTAVLEPDLFGEQYVRVPDDAPTRPTSRQINAKKPSAETLDAIAYWRNFEQDNAGKELLTAEQWRTAIEIRDAVHADPIARTIFAGGRAEQSVHAKDAATGLHIKCRIDYLNDAAGLIGDLKTTDDASPADFGRHSANFRYHVQCGYYRRVMREAFGEAPPYWVFVAVEKDPPYAIGVYFVDEEIASLGARLAERDLRRLAQALDSDQWPAYTTSQVSPLVLPGWYVRQAEDSLL